MGDNFNSGGGNMNIAKDQGTAVQTNYSLNEQVAVEELLTLLGKVQQELSSTATAKF